MKPLWRLFYFLSFTVAELMGIGKYLYYVGAFFLSRSALSYYDVLSVMMSRWTEPQFDAKDLIYY